MGRREEGKQSEALKLRRPICPLSRVRTVYYDNVGGSILDAALGRLNFKGTTLGPFTMCGSGGEHTDGGAVYCPTGRVVICGAISQYNKPKSEVKGPSNYLSLLVNRGRMEGFILFDYAKRYGEAIRAVRAGDGERDEG